MPRQIKTHVFRGSKYKIEVVAPSKMTDGDLGSCDPPDKNGKKIKINSSLKGQEELEVLIHEALHANFFDLDEPAIDEAARDLAAFLWRWKYRKVQ